MTEPTTEAGRRKFRKGGAMTWFTPADILAIEAEARASLDVDVLARIRRADDAWTNAPDGFDGIRNHPETQCQADIDRHVLLRAILDGEPKP